jgi:non-ribosomal peptide synthetase component F
VLINEVNELYAAYSRGESSPLEELPIQYADYAVWQREWLQGASLEEELEYWRKQLAGVEVLKLPSDHPRPAAPTYRGAKQSFLLESELVEALRELSRQEETTLFMTLLAAFQTLLYHYTGQEDIVVGTPIANRNRLELEALIGFFINTLALRIKLRPEYSFRELLRQVRTTALAAYCHDQVPFEKLVTELSPKRVLGQNPILQTWFYLDNRPSNDNPISSEITLSPFTSDASSAKLDLALTMAVYSNGISGSFTYATDLFEPETVIAMVERFQTLIQAVVVDPDSKLFDLPLAGLTKTQAIGSLDEAQATFVF